MQTSSSSSSSSSTRDRLLRCVLTPIAAPATFQENAAIGLRQSTGSESHTVRKSLSHHDSLAPIDVCRSPVHRVRACPRPRRGRPTDLVLVFKRAGGVAHVSPERDRQVQVSHALAWGVRGPCSRVRESAHTARRLPFSISAIVRCGLTAGPAAPPAGGASGREDSAHRRARAGMSASDCQFAPQRHGINTLAYVRSWVARSWMARSWMTRSWMARSWMARSWMARSWMARSLARASS